MSSALDVGEVVAWLLVIVAGEEGNSVLRNLR